MKRVLFVANASKIGGGNRVLMNLMLHLDSARYSPAIVAPSEGPLVDWAGQHNIPCVLSKGGDYLGRAALVRRTLDLVRVLNRLRPAIVHAAAPMCYRAVGVAAWLRGTIRVCHLGFPPAPGELERCFLSGPEAVIGCYEAQATEHAALIAQLSPGCRVVGIQNAIDTDHFKPSVIGEDRERWRFGARHVVAIVGHISEVKGYPEFLDAAACIRRAHPDSAFVAVGVEHAQPGFRQQMEEKARRLGIAERMHFVGYQDDVAPILRAADVVVLPSHNEGFPLAVLEAMACGKPVIATSVGGVPEAIENGRTGILVPPEQADALAAAIMELLSDPNRAEDIGRSARLRMEEHFSLRRFAARVQDLYTDLLQRPPGRRAKQVVPRAGNESAARR